MTRLLLLRHAETAAPHLFHGAESDVAISDAGRLATEALAPTLARLQPAAIYSSALQRAVQTAQILAQAANLSPQIEPDLHERKMGSLSGQLRDDHWHAYESTRDAWVLGRLEATHNGAESFADVRARAVPALRRIVAAHPAQTVLVVAHGITLRVLIASLAQAHSHADFRRLAIPNLALYELHAQGPPPWPLARQPEPVRPTPGTRVW